MVNAKWLITSFEHQPPSTPLAVKQCCCAAWFLDVCSILGLQAVYANHPTAIRASEMPLLQTESVLLPSMQSLTMHKPSQSISYTWLEESDIGIQQTSVGLDHGNIHTQCFMPSLSWFGVGLAGGMASKQFIVQSVRVCNLVFERWQIISALVKSLSCGNLCLFC